MNQLRLIKNLCYEWMVCAVRFMVHSIVNDEWFMVRTTGSGGDKVLVSRMAIVPRQPWSTLQWWLRMVNNKC